MTCRAVLFFEQFFDASDVFRDIHAYGVVRNFRDSNSPAIFQPTQLLELLDALEFALRQRGIFEERVALKYIQAEMLEEAHLNFAGGIAHPGNWRARKIDPVIFEI